MQTFTHTYIAIDYKSMTLLEYYHYLLFFIILHTKIGAAPNSGGTRFGSDLFQHKLSPEQNICHVGASIVQNLSQSFLCQHP